MSNEDKLRRMINMIREDCRLFGVRYPADILLVNNNSRNDFQFYYDDRLGYTLVYWERGNINWGMNSLDEKGFRFLFQRHIILHNFQSIPESAAFMAKAEPVFGNTKEYKEASPVMNKLLNFDDKQSISTSLFLIPVAFEGEEEYPEKPDHELHFGVYEAQMAQFGSKLNCNDLPDSFTPARTARKSVMHYQTLQAPDGKRYIPLFTSYKHIQSIFGGNIRLGVICFETAKKFVLKESLDGIVVSPGSKDAIIPRKDLTREKNVQDSEAYTEKKDDKCQDASESSGICAAEGVLDTLRVCVDSGSASTDEIAGIILDLNRQFRKCDECRICRKISNQEPAEHITGLAHEITEILAALDTEKYVDLMNALSDDLTKNISDDHTRSVLPILIDDYELRIQNVLQEKTKLLQKEAVKQEFKVVFLFFSRRLVDDFICKTEEWLRYVNPLIKSAAARNTENSFVNESVKCLEELTYRALYKNDQAVYRLTTAFAKYFADIPSVMQWVIYYNHTAMVHLSRHPNMF